LKERGTRTEFRWAQEPTNTETSTSTHTYEMIYVKIIKIEHNKQQTFFSIELNYIKKISKRLENK